MNPVALNSALFVINAGYYYSFLNAVIFAVIKDSSRPLGPGNVVIDLSRLESYICGVICLIITLRYFLGNSKFLSDAMLSKDTTPLQKIFHFLLIWSQSFVLLIASYFVSAKLAFVILLGMLFCIEVIWFIGACLIDQSTVSKGWRSDLNSLPYAEFENTCFVLGLWLIYRFVPLDSSWWITSVAIIFVVNTLLDLRRNLHSYMGHRS